MDIGGLFPDDGIGMFEASDDIIIFWIGRYDPGRRLLCLIKRILDQGSDDLIIDAFIQQNRDPVVLIHVIGFMKTFFSF